MLRHFTLGLFVCITFLSSNAVWAANVALNKPVTLNGTYGVLRSPTPWPDATTYPVAAASTITDGTFVGNGTEWQDGTVWWDATVRGSDANTIVIDLQGAYKITHLAIEADNNDDYPIEYRDPGTNTWHPWVYAPTYNTGGMLTRSGNVGPVITDGLRIYGANGDGYYSVSELQAEGIAVPVPAALPAGIALMVGAAMVRTVRRAMAQQ